MAIVVGKSLIFGALARGFGYRNMAPGIIGLGLSQIGEFSFVLARTGRAGTFITKDTFDLALSCAVLSMALSPLVFPGLLPMARAIARRLRPLAPAIDMPLPRTTLENHVVVAGYGRTGHAVVDALQAVGLPYLIVEMHHEALARPLEQGVPVIWATSAAKTSWSPPASRRRGCW